MERERKRGGTCLKHTALDTKESRVLLSAPLVRVTREWQTLGRRGSSLAIAPSPCLPSFFSPAKKSTDPPPRQTDMARVLRLRVEEPHSNSQTDFLCGLAQPSLQRGDNSHTLTKEEAAGHLASESQPHHMKERNEKGAPKLASSARAEAMTRERLQRETSHYSHSRGIDH